MTDDDGEGDDEGDDQVMTRCDGDDDESGDVYGDGCDG